MPLAPRAARNEGEVTPHDVGTTATLSCPRWVRFAEAQSGATFFFDVATGERCWEDPDPVGQHCCFPIFAGEVGSASNVSTGDMLAPQAADCDVWRTRPARLQKAHEPGKVSYTEGDEDYNVWYGKYENNRFDKKDREPAPFRCDPDMDAGWTEADKPGAQATAFCLFFAQGCCTRGAECTYYHHVPSLAEANEVDVAHDIFGRLRFGSHRDDMQGVGSFNSDCQTLYVGDLNFDRKAADAVQQVEAMIWKEFGVWGPIQEVRLIVPKAMAFVRYTYRAAAEFAKVAMASQSLGKARMLCVRWSFDDGNRRAAHVKRRKMEREALVDAAVERKACHDGLSVVDVAGIQLRNQPSSFIGVTAPYPDTVAQYRDSAHPRALEASVEAAAEHAASSNLRCLSAALARVNANVSLSTLSLTSEP
eukprot:TRINITY_DN31069_c1_g1_i1.p1 TRINITY_DN31069_c1_g1~~TRINITY_DN31069_c1_g1_i1.p1  ORF type:complete len:446 (+),score=79.29 TRINITY_DN31069_c1_g1_i1:79-1338(+)